MHNTNIYTYSNMEIGTRIFFKGDEKDPSGLGTIKVERPDGYYIEMDSGKSFFVHPELFESFGALFQVMEERLAKISWLILN